MSSEPLTTEQIEQFHRDGYLIVESMFDAEEMELLKRAAKEDHELEAHAYSKEDGEGGKVRMSLWNHPGEGIYGMFARCLRIVDGSEQLLGEEVYHYHSKMIMKDPKVGGAWTWHQDYGYWYQNGCLWPRMVSATIAVDAATPENGCMQFLKASHKLERIDHVLTGDQAGADMERVNEALERGEVVHCRMKPGDVCFFHCNLLHRSDQNRSENPRWAMICCYNAASNDPYKDSHHPRYTPLSKVDDSRIKEVGVKRFSDDESDVAWLEDTEDQSARGLDSEERAGGS